MSEPVLSIDGLTVGYRRDEPVVRNFALSVAAGETVALVGESGSGKSTVARAATQLLRPWSGSVRLAGVELTSLRGRALARARAAMQMVFQDPSTALDPRQRIGAAIAEPLRYLTTLDRAARQHRVADLLREVGLEPAHAARWPHELSGGQRQRAVIARALAPDPRLLLCDEAVSALDVSVQAQVLNLLHDLQQRRSLSLVFITHDLAVVRAIANRVVVLEHGRIVEQAATTELFEHPRHPYTKRLLAAIPQPNQAWMRQQAMRSTGWFSAAPPTPVEQSAPAAPPPPQDSA